jgi:hypothetical protein
VEALRPHNRSDAAACLDGHDIRGHRGGMSLTDPPPTESDPGSWPVNPEGAHPPDSTEYMPAPGELHIKERRSWRTWQVAVVAVAAILVGMLLNYHTVGSSQASTAKAYSLPPPARSGSTTATTVAPTTAGSHGAATTTTAAGGTTTTTPGSSTTTTAVAGPARVLLSSAQMSGNWTSTAFTTTAANWSIGWAFRCTPPPAGGPAFQIFVTPVGGKPTGTAAVSQTASSGQSVTPQSSLGQQTLVVQTSASCVWVVKVTGS